MTDGSVDPSFISSILNPTANTLADDITNTNTNLFGSGADPTATTPVQSQAVVDAVHQAVHGGVATGLPASTVGPNLLKIPQANVAIQASNSTTVTFDAAGTWTAEAPATTGATLTGTHVVGASADYLLVLVPYYAGSVPGAMTVTCGSTPMALLNSITTDLGIAAFGLASPSTGSQSITVTVPSTTTVYFLGAESTSLVGVSSVGTIAATSGAHSNPSMTVGSDTGRIVTQMFLNVTTSSGSAALSSYSQTSLANTGDVTASVGGYDNYAAVSGYAAGASSISFTATSATTTTAQSWLGLAVELRPSTSAEVGSGFRQYRSLTGTVGTSTGATYFPSTFFDQNQYCTADITPTTVGGAPSIQVSYAGWYMVKINCLLASTSTNYYIRPVLYQGSSVVQHGDTLYVSTTTTNFTVGDSFIVYCNAGDTIGPGYWCSTTVANLLTGESLGEYTYWEVALLNRSYM